MQLSHLSLPQEILTSLTTSHFLKHKPDPLFTINSNITFTLVTLIEIHIFTASFICGMPFPSLISTSQIATIKARIKAYVWNNFADNFDDDNPCMYLPLPLSIQQMPRTSSTCKLSCFVNCWLFSLALYICVLGCKHWLLADPWHTCHKAIINK